MIPCDQDQDFIADRISHRRRAAEKCATCPVFDLCEEVGIGEEHGVYAGTLENDPIRTVFRKENRAAWLKGHRCLNGHDLGTADEPTENRVQLKGVLLHESNLPGVGCARCTTLRNAIDRERRAERPDYVDLIPA